MKARISGSVAGHLELAEGDRFDLTGRTYTGSPVYTIEVRKVRPAGRYGNADHMTASGPRRLKSGRVSENGNWVELELPDEDAPPEVLAAVKRLRARVVALRSIIAREEGDTTP